MKFKKSNFEPPVKKPFVQLMQEKYELNTPHELIFAEDIDASGALNGKYVLNGISAIAAYRDNPRIVCTISLITEDNKVLFITKPAEIVIDYELDKSMAQIDLFRWYYRQEDDPDERDNYYKLRWNIEDYANLSIILTPSDFVKLEQMKIS